MNISVDFRVELMNERVFFLKPCRETDEQPMLSDTQIGLNLAQGVETCAVLDLNVLNRFKQHCNRESTDLPAEVKADIEALKEQLTRPLFISAGFAFGEADESYLDELVDAYETFFASELLGYQDTPNSLPVGRERVRSRRYVALPPTEQQILSFSYLALLKVHDILLSSDYSSGEAKFDAFLEFMDGVADVVPAVEIEIAKHCFFTSTSIDDELFVNRSKAIRANFNKGGRGETRVERILNGARDIMYVRSAAYIDGRELDGRVQDTWLLTCDKGIAALCNVFYFHPMNGERAKYATTVNSVARIKDSYWRYVDRAASGLIADRSKPRRNASSLSREDHMKKLAGWALDLASTISARTGQP